MEIEGTEVLRKRRKPDVEKEGERGDEAEHKILEETETNFTGSEEMECNISHILEKIERFTQLISELLESGKTMFKELSNEFEERLIIMHKEQMEKWQKEIKELRLLDASNEEANVILHNAQYLLENRHVDSRRSSK